MRLLVAMLMAWLPLQNCYSEDKTNIFVSILPQKYLVERIAGNHANVSVIVNHGHSHETYEPSPKQMEALKKAQLYFKIGMPFEKIWIDTIKELYANLKIIECCAQLNLQTTKNTIHDTHIWTNPINTKHIAGSIKEALIMLLPQYQQKFQYNYAQLIIDIDALDLYIRNTLAKSKNHYIFTYHPAWGHYAEIYKLEQIPIQLEGREISAKYLAELIEFAKLQKIHRIFVQPQFNQSYATVIAKEIGARIIEIDPLVEDYINNLYYVTDIIANNE